MHVSLLPWFEHNGSRLARQSWNDKQHTHLMLNCFCDISREPRCPLSRAVFLRVALGNMIPSWKVSSPSNVAWCRSSKVSTYHWFCIFSTLVPTKGRVEDKICHMGNEEGIEVCAQYESRWGRRLHVGFVGRWLPHIPSSRTGPQAAETCSSWIKVSLSNATGESGTCHKFNLRLDSGCSPALHEKLSTQFVLLLYSDCAMSRACIWWLLEYRNVCLRRGRSPLWIM